MTSPPAPLFSALPSVLFCLTLIGAADSTATAGFVVGWGDDTYGQATPLDAVAGVGETATDVSAGGEHSCAIQAETGNVVCWGHNYWGGTDTYLGQATPPDAVNGVSGTATDIAAGWHPQLCDPGGHGQRRLLGLGNFYGQATPPAAVNGTFRERRPTSQAGGLHSCSIQAGTGNAVCWGDNPSTASDDAPR